MWTKVTIIGCLLLTGFVLHTALRIEYVNELIGTFLPRNPGYEQEKWQVPPLEQVLNFVDAQIAKQRSNLFSLEHPDEALPPTESFVGAPYNESERGFIDRHKRDHANFQALHWWVNNFGALQYSLAPLAFFWSVGNLLALKKVLVRGLSVACAGLAFYSIYLMILRGY